MWCEYVSLLIYYFVTPTSGPFLLCWSIQKFQTAYKIKKENKTNPFNSSTLDSKAERNRIKEMAMRFRDE